MPTADRYQKIDNYRQGKQPLLDPVHRVTQLYQKKRRIGTKANCKALAMARARHCTSSEAWETQASTEVASNIIPTPVSAQANKFFSRLVNNWFVCKKTANNINKEYITAFLFVIHFLDADDYINTHSLLSIIFFGHFTGLLFSPLSLAHTTLQT